MVDVLFKASPKRWRVRPRVAASQKSQTERGHTARRPRQNVHETTMPARPLRDGETRDAFDALDDERSGRLPPSRMTALLRARGLRVTASDVAAEVREANFRRRERGWEGDRRSGSGGGGNDDDGGGDPLLLADADLAEEIVARRLGSSSSSSSADAELRETFRLFDRSGRGAISLEDLREVASEIGAGSEAADGDLLRAMIDAFDRDLDGAISLEEFRRILLSPART